MEQRRLRLGDIVDDYCPRERRVTNHAIVAMIEEDVKQTRCTTCDAEHAYKGGQAPRRRKSETAGALYKAVLANVAEPEQTPAAAPSNMPESPENLEPVPARAEPAAPLAPEHAVPPSAADSAPGPDEPLADPAEPPADEGPVHRPLIRAQLPRPEGMKVERTAPDFTIRQNGRGFRREGNVRNAGGPGGARGGHQRFGHGHGQQRRNGQRFGGRKRSR